MENNQQYMLDIQALRADILATNVKLDTHYIEYMNKFDNIEKQTTKTNGRVNWHDKMIYMAVGGGGLFVLIPTLNAIVSKLSN